MHFSRCKKSIYVYIRLATAWTGSSLVGGDKKQY